MGNGTNDQIKEYKVEVYLPLEALDSIRNTIMTLKAGVIGSYYNCMSWYKIRSSWSATEDSSPYIGKAGEECEIDEYKIETRCTEDKLEEMIKAIKNAHPYENVCINVLPLITV